MGAEGGAPAAGSAAGAPDAGIAWRPSCTGGDLDVVFTGVPDSPGTGEQFRAVGKEEAHPSLGGRTGAEAVGYTESSKEYDTRNTDTSPAVLIADPRAGETWSTGSGGEAGLGNRRGAGLCSRRGSDFTTGRGTLIGGTAGPSAREAARDVFGGGDSTQPKGPPGTHGGGGLDGGTGMTLGGTDPRGFGAGGALPVSGPLEATTVMLSSAHTLAS